ncbi:ATP-binding region ATPase domain protein [Gemmatirosa kalamazoonensis]|uniref:histidine kinase n=2 Tax=Gemmatirosa kalamazoonensis TaxID=861299 RepID=W0RMS0_9BACT|nr:ATP-binding region ATPase domain protein [Gemmatirosa kalamazoonensis]
MLLVALGVTAMLGWYVMYTQSVVQELRREAERQGRIYAQTYRAVLDTSTTDREGRLLAALFSIIVEEQSAGIPMIVTGSDGGIQGYTNLSVARSKLRNNNISDADIRALMPVLARQNTPIEEPGVGRLYYGDSKLVRGLRYVPLLQAFAIMAIVGVGLYALLIRARAEREHVWAGMARESAHQLGTPLSSISGWIALLDDEVEDQGTRADPMLKSAVNNMKADLERLERVAHRFERIGRPPRREPVDVVALVERMAKYFRARVPTRAHTVTIDVKAPAEPLTVKGDAVLLEWVIEALTKNAVDALAGRGGRIELCAESLADGTTRVRVADDGPGVPRELRRRIFDAGYSTKERGWGIGLSLARRIVEENHGGKLVLAPTERGAAFDVILR